MGQSVVPARSMVSPAAASLPALRMWAAGSGTLRMPTRSMPRSVSSIGTTASAPSGIGAPVMIRATCPASMRGF
ncbi:hypothetical protein QN345_18980, partial [Cryobacterium sp. 10I1]